MLTLLVCLAGIVQMSAQEVYRSLRVWSTNEGTLQQLHAMGIPLDHIQIKEGVYIDLIASEDQTDRLAETGILFDVIIADLTEHFVSRSIPEIRRDFELGSMLGNYTFAEVVAKMDTLAFLYPDIVSVKDSIGTSIEGRAIWVLKVSDNVAVDESEPEVLYTGLTHAREPLSMMNQFYFIEWLCENYNTDDRAAYLVNQREMWFIPVINPDGYVYNESIAPDGGGLHRKNRRDTGCGSDTQRGVDLNRNYSYNWGVDDSGSSPDPCSDTFRGDYAFSEPETQIVRDFILEHEFSNVLHYHSYSNVLIHSWGDGTYPADPDLTTLREIGNEMTKINGYQVGTGYETIFYGVNGDAVDWSYGEVGLIAYTPEVGSYQDNFWPPENRVISLCVAQLYANQIFAFVGGADHIVYKVEHSNQNDDTLHFYITIQNRGLLDSDGDVMVNAIPNSDEISLLDYITNLGHLMARDTIPMNISLITDGDIANGTEVSFILTINDNTSFVRSDTIVTIIGDPQVVFADSAEEGLDQWATFDWGIEADSSTGDHAFTDSPGDNYANNVNSGIALSNPIDITHVDHPTVHFKAKWDIENNYDFVRFQISTDNLHWTSLAGLHTENGSDQGTQTAGEPGYDGQSNWVLEVIDIENYSAESEVYFRFIISADEYVTGDGFYFDDFTIQGYLNYVPGDVVADGELNIIDILTIVDLILSNVTLNEYQQLRCDVNLDGLVNMDDVLVLVEKIIRSE